MYSTCLHCTGSLGTNDVLETLPVGRRVAFDAAHGRLWVICRSCGKWNLVPFDTRLETIDECERQFRDTRTRYSTDNIGLARTREGLDVVRIGAPLLPEFASWRYGAQYRRRRRINLTIAGAGIAMSQVAIQGLDRLVPESSLLIGVPASAAIVLGVTSLSQVVQNRRLRVLTTLPDSDDAVAITKDTAMSAHLAVADDDMAVSWSPGIIAAMRKRRVTVAGPDARLLTRKILGLVNRNAGSKGELDGAIERIGTGGIDRWLRQLGGDSVSWSDFSRRGRLRIVASSFTGRVRRAARSTRLDGFDAGSFQLNALPPSDRLAIEMWLSEEDEAKALAGELALLERQWKEAEHLAQIADALGAGSLPYPSPSTASGAPAPPASS